MNDAETVFHRLLQPYRRAAPARAGAVLDLLADRIARYPTTPVEAFDVRVEGRVRRILLKLEGESPWRSIKGRTAISLICSVAHRITDGSRLVESTSGNLGVALAALAADLGLPFTAVVDDRLPDMMRRRMRAFGAELLPADGADGADRLQSRLNTVARQCAEDPGVVWPNQYDNPMNPRVHEIWTGPELLAQAPDAQALFVGVSTGGTLAGVSRAARAARPELKIVGVDVEGSRAFGGAAGVRILTGIGSGIPSRYLGDGVCDAVEVVSSLAGARQCRAWREATGLGLGGSSGAVLAAALGHLARHPELDRVLCLCPDLGENYADTIYDDAWALGHGLDAGSGAPHRCDVLSPVPERAS